MSFFRENYQRTVAPEFTCVTLDRAKKHLKMEDVDEDNDYIITLVEAATSWAERFCGIAIMRQTWKLSIFSYTSWPTRLLIAKPGNVVAITEVKYLDASNELQTLDSSKYDLTKRGSYSYVQFYDTDNLPAISDDEDQTARIEVIYACGYSNSDVEATQQAAVPKDVASAILMKTASLYERREDHKRALESAAENLLAPLRENWV